MGHYSVEPMKTTFLLSLFHTLIPFTISASTTDSSGDFLNDVTVREAIDESPWEITGAASIGVAKGNADSVNYALNTLAKYKNGDSEGHIGGDFFFSEDNDDTTTNSLRFFSKYTRLLGDRFHIGAFGTFLSDEVADLDYRFDAGITLGYHFIKNDSTKLSFELGPGYTWEEQGALSDHYFSLRLAQLFEHKLNKDLKIWQSAILTPEASEFKNTLFITEAGLEILLTREWSLRTSLRYQYDNTTANGRDKSDVLLLTGLSYSLGGFSRLDAPDRMTLKPNSAEPEEITMGWTSSAALNFTLAQGNSDNLFLGTTLDSTYRRKEHETFMALAYSYSENGGNTSSDSIRASIQHNRICDERYLIGGRLNYFRDDFADVNFRLIPTGSLGYYFIKNDEMTLSFEVGPGFTFEEVGGISDDFFTINAAQRFTWEISDRLTLSQNITGSIDPSDGNNYMLSAGANLDIDITPNLSWRIAAAWTKDNTPAEGRDYADSTLTTGISVKF